MGVRRFLVVDDHRLVASALARAVRYAAARDSEAPCEVLTAYSLEEALRALAAHDDWTGFMFDVQLGRQPDTSGIELLDAALRLYPHVATIMVSGLENPDVVREAGRRLIPYVLKPVPEVVVRRFVESALANREQTDRRLVIACRELVVRAGLTPAEASVLRLALAHRSREEILENLDITENTLKSHVKRILRRTGASSLNELVDSVLGRVLGGGGAR